MQEVRFLVNIDELNKQIKACYKCRLAESRLNVLCGEGNMQARVMLVAQAPGEAEDRDGRMFIVPSGRVLDDLLSANQVNRRELYITNLVKCMLPKYRKPKQDEIQACARAALSGCIFRRLKFAALFWRSGYGFSHKV